MQGAFLVLTLDSACLRCSCSAPWSPTPLQHLQQMLGTYPGVVSAHKQRPKGHLGAPECPARLAAARPYSDLLSAFPSCAGHTVAHKLYGVAGEYPSCSQSRGCAPWHQSSSLGAASAGATASPACSNSLRQKIHMQMPVGRTQHCSPWGLRAGVQLPTPWSAFLKRVLSPPPGDTGMRGDSLGPDATQLLAHALGSWCLPKLKLGTQQEQGHSIPGKGGKESGKC